MNNLAHHRIDDTTIRRRLTLAIAGMVALALLLVAAAAIVSGAL